MTQIYTDKTRESEPHALPNAEVFKGYEHECQACQASFPLFPDYYGILYPKQAECPECAAISSSGTGARCIDTKVKWYWWPCFPGCMPDSDPMGPFDSEQAAIDDAQENGG